MAEKEYTVVAPDGKEITLIGPVGATQEEIIAQAQRLYKPQATTQTGATQEEQPKPAGAYDRFLESLRNPQTGGKSGVVGPMLVGGTGELIKGAGALTQFAFPEAGNRMVEVGEAITQGAKSVAPVSTTIGQVGSYALPAAQLQRGVTAGRTAIGLNPIGKIPSFAVASGEQAAIGGALGYGLTPDQQNREQAGFAGFGFGAISPTVAGLINKGATAVRTAVEPLYQAGRERIVGRVLRETAGSETPTMVRNLANPQQFVRGSEPTVGQAAGVPSIAALERSVVATSPEATNLIAARQRLQNQARAEALRNIAPDTRTSKYIDLRTKVADELYETAVTSRMDDIPKDLLKDAQSLSQAPAIKSAMEQAKINALNKGYDIKNPEGSMRGLHETKLALDDEIARLNVPDPTSAQKAKIDALKAAKGRLLNFIETVNPDYKKARETFSRLSKPIDQLESIQAITGKAIKPEREEILAGTFARELAKARKEGVLSDRQIKRLEDINKDIQRSQFAETEGRGVGSNTAQNIAYNNMMNELGIPTSMRSMAPTGIMGNVLGRAGDIVYGRANKELQRELAETMLNPSQASQAVEAARPVTNKERQKLARLLITTGGAQIGAEKE